MSKIGGLLKDLKENAGFVLFSSWFSTVLEKSWMPWNESRLRSERSTGIPVVILMCLHHHHSLVAQCVLELLFKYCTCNLVWQYTQIKLILVEMNGSLPTSQSSSLHRLKCTFGLEGKKVVNRDQFTTESQILTVLTQGKYHYALQNFPEKLDKRELKYAADGKVS